jgi:hypothetical protein
VKPCLFCWTDKLDIWYARFESKGEMMFSRLIEAVKWSWDQMTFLSVLILLLIISISGLAWLTLSDRKKYMSRAYWRGFKDGKKK